LQAKQRPTGHNLSQMFKIKAVKEAGIFEFANVNEPSMLGPVWD
jgi:hypothetical protein